jgi:hypothetical protein
MLDARSSTFELPAAYMDGKRGHLYRHRYQTRLWESAIEIRYHVRRLLAIGLLLLTFTFSLPI